MISSHKEDNRKHGYLPIVYDQQTNGLTVVIPSPGRSSIARPKETKLDVSLDEDTVTHLDNFVAQITFHVLKLSELHSRCC